MLFVLRLAAVLALLAAAVFPAHADEVDPAFDGLCAIYVGKPIAIVDGREAALNCAQLKGIGAVFEKLGNPFAYAVDIFKQLQGTPYAEVKRQPLPENCILIAALPALQCTGKANKVSFRTRISYRDDGHFDEWSFSYPDMSPVFESIVDEQARAGTKFELLPVGQDLILDLMLMWIKSQLPPNASVRRESGGVEIVIRRVEKG